MTGLSHFGTMGAGETVRKSADSLSALPTHRVYLIRSLVVLLFLMCAGLFFAADVQARGTYEPPRNGLESPDSPHRQKGNPGAAALIDAYGNPISVKEADKAPSKRLAPGAYGADHTPKDNRPLPREKDNRPLW